MNHVALFILACLGAFVVCHRLDMVRGEELWAFALAFFVVMECVLVYVRYRMAAWHDRQSERHQKQRRKWLGN